eukprot:gene16817-18513_t
MPAAMTLLYLLAVLLVVNRQTNCMPFDYNPETSNSEMHISSGPCITPDHQTLQRGQWTAIENCAKNCTCDSLGILSCIPWCMINLKVCRAGEAESTTEYFERIGETGCKRCVTIACDAIIPETNERVSKKEISVENELPLSEDGFKVLKTIETVYEKVK